MSPTSVWALRWCDVDPATHPFDARPAREIAERLLLGTLLPPASDDPTAPTDPRLYELKDAIDAAWIAEYGSWAAGWRWGASEPGIGGPVHAYCCATHSLSDDHSADVVVAALCEWRQWLEPKTVKASLTTTRLRSPARFRNHRNHRPILPMSLPS